MAASRYDADSNDREAWTQAQIADQQRRTEAEMSGLERRERTTQVERYFWMALAAMRAFAGIAIALELARAL